MDNEEILIRIKMEIDKCYTEIGKGRANDELMTLSSSMFKIGRLLNRANLNTKKEMMVKMESDCNGGLG